MQCVEVRPFAMEKVLEVSVVKLQRILGPWPVKPAPADVAAPEGMSPRIARLSPGR